jgi:hypothetical protein
MTETLSALIKRYDEDHAFLRNFVVPEEDRHLFTSAKWAGEYRWFRSENVVCLEKARLIHPGGAISGGSRAATCCR